MISDLIRELVKDWVMDPVTINSGYCGDFADEVEERYGQALEQRNSYNYDPFLPGHIWIYFMGKHYDAECPDGVELWKDLPFFQRFEKDYHDLLANCSD